MQRRQQEELDALKHHQKRSDLNDVANLQSSWTDRQSAYNSMNYSANQSSRSSPSDRQPQPSNHNNDSNSNNCNNLLNDDLLLRVLRNFTMDTSNNGQSTSTQMPITLNQIREEQSKQWNTMTGFAINNHIDCTSNGGNSTSLQSSPIKRTPSMTNAMLYGQQSFSLNQHHPQHPHHHPQQQHQQQMLYSVHQPIFSMPKNAAASRSIHGVTPHPNMIGLNHSASSSHLHHYLQPTSVLKPSTSVTSLSGAVTASTTVATTPSSHSESSGSISENECKYFNSSPS